ncbi:Hypothetical protein CINCED_3A000884 [Cinara cedri]|uniref:Uncharacterized protein n=1 Tax=Cinara cedri TaxID=506608 RepID=A0A5E4NAH3_9HEMI|nr:Hypothetical protein CINCED_3A000884 [Cinara cedri]
MLERLYSKRTPIMNVFADRTVTAVSVTRKLEISECEWSIIEQLIVLLKPLQALTKLFCGELGSSFSMDTIAYQLTTRIELQWKDIVIARHIASFLDPKYKNIDHEPSQVREIIRSHVLRFIESIALNISQNMYEEE